ncbi:MAG TPA: hypothetical protein VK168_14130 [Saprospiraceae bacterium]|nr:hypothetical protein [Saprospiraceae bacterium]
MKRIFVLLLALLAVAGCDKVLEPEPDEHPVPETVIEAVVEQFPGATNLTLQTLQADAFYAAEFWVQAQHYQAIISQDGSFQELNLELPVNDLTPNGLDFITHQFQTPAIQSLYAQLDPGTQTRKGYLVKTIGAGKEYLLKLDTLGARISMMEVPVSPWWRREVANIGALPQNIQTVLLSQIGYLLHDANWFVDSNRVSTWQAAIRNSNFLTTYRFDASGNVVSSVSEDLLALDAPNTTFLELDVTSLPTVMSNFLHARFAGWTYHRGILILQNNSPNGFSVMIRVNQALYYTRFDISGNFIGATRG